MELHKLNCDEIRGWEAAQRRDLEDQVRKELADMRMDIYTAKAQHSAKVKGLKKSLARILTVNKELAKK